MQIEFDLDPSSYTVLEGDQVDLTIMKLGDTALSFTIMLSTIDGTAVGTVRQ